MAQELGAQVQMAQLVQAVCQIQITRTCITAHMMEKSETTTALAPGGVRWIWSVTIQQYAIA